MLARVQIAPMNGWNQPGSFLAMCQHEFSATPDGQIQHATDGVVRAVVPPEGWKDYAEAWPPVGELAGELRRAPVADMAAVAQAAAEAALKATAPQV